VNCKQLTHTTNTPVWASFSEPGYQYTFDWTLQSLLSCLKHMSPSWLDLTSILLNMPLILVPCKIWLGRLWIWWSRQTKVQNTPMVSEYCQL